MLEKIVRERYFFFSYTYNLSKSIQSNIKELVNDAQVEEVKNDEGVFWNKFDTNYVFNKNRLTFKNIDDPLLA